MVLLASSLDEAELQKLGLDYAGFYNRQNCSSELNERRFRAHYGVGPAAIKLLIPDLEGQGKSVDTKKLFLAICWLKLYDLENTMAARTGWGEKYCRDTVHDYVKRIHELKKKKINFDGMHPKSTFLGVDTFHAATEEFRGEPSNKWWSHKFNGPAVSFETVSDPVDSKIR